MTSPVSNSQLDTISANVVDEGTQALTDLASKLDEKDNLSAGDMMRFQQKIANVENMVSTASQIDAKDKQNMKKINSTFG